MENNIYMPLRPVISNAVLVKPTNIPEYFDTQQLLNCYWVVPYATIKAYAYKLDETLEPVIDQTVWEYTYVDGRYIFGNSYTCFQRDDGTRSYSKATVSGSITPDNLISIDVKSSSNQLGIGTLKKNTVTDKWYFVMQTNNDSLVIHWSYMVKATIDSEYYNNLPGINISIPELIDNCSP